jgi:hypothetical protein
MKYKSFTSKSEMVHKKFICKEFALDFRNYGADFIFGDTAMELKGKKRYRKTVTFVCSEAQVHEWEETHGAKNLIWMFMLYDLNCKVSSIRSQSAIEAKVENREFWLLPWNFIKDKKVHRYTSWGPHYHFTTKDFPPNMVTREINGVSYHCTEDKKIESLFLRREFLKN